MSETLGVSVLSLELADNRWYHLDTCLCPISPDTEFYYPGAFDRYAQDVISHTFNTIEVSEAEALRFACNSVVLGNDVIIPSGCPDITAELRKRGYRTFSVDMSEFLKAGGACKCLTLHLK